MCEGHFVIFPRFNVFGDQCERDDDVAFSGRKFGPINTVIICQNKKCGGQVTSGDFLLESV